MSDAADTSLFPNPDASATGGDAAGAAGAAGGTGDAAAAGKTGDQGQAAGDAKDTKAAGADDKAGDGKGAEGDKGGAKEGDKPAGAPEQYEAFKLPDGFEMDETLLAEATPVLKGLNLTQEQAQQVMDLAPKLVAAATDKAVANTLEVLGLQDRANWAQQVRTDKDIGGEKVGENVAIARLAADQLFSAETKAFLTKTGLGNFPALVRDMHKFGKTLKQDSGAPGTAKAASTASFYDNSSMNP